MSPVRMRVVPVGRLLALTIGPSTHWEGLGVLCSVFRHSRVYFGAPFATPSALYKPGRHNTRYPRIPELEELHLCGSDQIQWIVWTMTFVLWGL
jgi:hypothetical protein